MYVTQKVMAPNVNIDNTCNHWCQTKSQLLQNMPMVFCLFTHITNFISDNEYKM